MDFTHESGIGDSVLPCTGIDTIDPQTPEITFLVLPVTVGILLAFFPSIDRNGPDILTFSEVSSGQTEDFLPSCS